MLTKYYLSDQINENEIGGARGTCGGEEGCYRVLVGRPEGKRPFERHSLRWE